MIVQRELRQQHLKERRVTVNYSLCFSCGACVAVCPPESLYLDNVHLSVNHQTCTGCERCIHVCPVRALAIRQ